MTEEIIQITKDLLRARELYLMAKERMEDIIPILPEDQLLVRQPDVTLLLAWNFADEIVAKQKEYIKKGGRFVRPIPVLELIRPRKK